jgi:hypothetical protein
METTMREPTFIGIATLLWNAQQASNAARARRIDAELMLADRLLDRADEIRQSNADRLAAIGRRVAALQERRRLRQMRGAGAAS